MYFRVVVNVIPYFLSYEKIAFPDDNSPVAIGKACIVNAGAVVNHNSTVEDYCQVDCNAVVAARALVPKGTKVMSGTVWMG